MSWNSSANRISEAKLKELEPHRADEIRRYRHVVINPTTSKRTFINPVAVSELRSSLLATLPFQPQTEMEKIIAETEVKEL